MSESTDLGEDEAYATRVEKGCFGSELPIAHSPSGYNIRSTVIFANVARDWYLGNPIDGLERTKDEPERIQ